MAALGRLCHKSSRLPILHLLAINVCCETNAVALWRRRIHELTDGREKRGDRLIMAGKSFFQAGLELRESTSEFLVRCQHLTQL